MGSSPSKTATNQIEPVLPRSESWSTLDGFVACELDKPEEPLAVSTTVNDKEIKQVKTWMTKQPKSTVNLDLHLDQIRKQHHLLPDTPDGAGHLGAFHSQDERTPTEHHNKQLLLEHSISRTDLAGRHIKRPAKVSYDLPEQAVADQRRVQRQATKFYNLEKQKSKIGHDLVKRAPTLHSNIGHNVPMKPKRQVTVAHDLLRAVDDPNKRMDDQIDALNVTDEPTNMRINRQIQRWKTQFALPDTHEHALVRKTKPMKPKPKHSKTFYDLRKAMVNREDVSLEHSSVVIKPLTKETASLKSQNSIENLPSIFPSTIGDVPIKDTKSVFEENGDSQKNLTKKTALFEENGTKNPVFEENIDSQNLTKVGPVKQEKEILPNDQAAPKLYPKDSFDYMISKDSPPGFEATLDSTESEKSCNSFVGNIQPRAVEVDRINQINETLKKWNSDGFFKCIEDFVLAKAPGSNYSVSDVAEAIASSNANYLASLGGNEAQVMMAKAYALYCWIAHNMTSNITSMLAAEEEQHGFAPEKTDVESKSASFDHCTLFVKLSLHVGLEAAVINGQVRTWKKLKEELNFPSPHSWNAVSIEGVPLLLDCFFGSGCVNDSFLGISKTYTSDYFGVPPQQLILTHLPHDPRHQFLECPLSVEDLQPIIPVPITTMRQGISPLTWNENHHVSTESQYPIVSVSLEVSNTSTIVSTELVPGPGISESLDQNVQLKRNGNRWNVTAAIPFKGQYSLSIFCKAHDDSPDDVCLSYIINAESDAELKLGYPRLHKSVQTLFDLNLIHWNSPQPYVCQSLSGLFNLVFEAKSGMVFDHFILPGRVSNPDAFTASNVKHYNTMLFSNKGSDTSLHQLQAVFPTNGWWTIHLSGALPNAGAFYANIPLMTYYVYVTIGLPRNSYPHVLSPDVLFNSTRPINATGEELFTVQFATSELLDLQHHLTYDQPTTEPREGFSKIKFEGKLKDSDCYIYSLRVIFSQPGVWYIHVFGKRKSANGTTPQMTALFKICADVKGAKTNTSFINYNDSIGELFGVRFSDDGMLTFPDSGQPLCYSFEALPQINFFHAIKMDVNEIVSRDYCTYLSSEDHANEQDSSTYTMHAVFPEKGEWLVQIFGAKEDSTNYSLVFTLNVSVACPTPHLCYPKLNRAFHQLKMGINSDIVLINKNCEDGEFIFPFTAPDNLHFTWSVSPTSSGDKMNSNAFIHRGIDTPNNRTLQVVFPKPGEWLVRLFAKQSTGSSGNFHSVLEFCLTSLSSKSGVSFPQVFEAFHSTFGLRFDMKHLPLVSEVHQLPAKVLIPIYSNNSNILFWHDIDVKGNNNESDEVFSLDDQCKIMSDPSTGQHKLMMEIISKGKWTVSLFAKKSTAVDKTWIAIVKFEVTAI